MVFHAVTALNDNPQCPSLRLCENETELCHFASNLPHVFPKWNIYDYLKTNLSCLALSSFLFITEVIEGQHSSHSFCFMTYWPSQWVRPDLLLPPNLWSFSLSVFFSFCNYEPKLRIQSLYTTNMHRIAHMLSMVGQIIQSEFGIASEIKPWHQPNHLTLCPMI